MDQMHVFDASENVHEAMLIPALSPEKRWNSELQSLLSSKPGVIKACFGQVDPVGGRQRHLIQEELHLEAAHACCFHTNVDTQLGG